MDNIDRPSVASLATTDAAPACLARRHSRWLSFCLDRRYSSTSLPPLAPSPLRDFPATMEALTPIRPALRSLHEHRLFGEQVSLIHVSDLPTPPSPTTPQALDADFARYPSSRRVSYLRRSRLHLVPAGSPTLTGRIEFVILRMDRSPPAAPHPASQRRSCSRLQAGERIPEEDFHLSDHTRFQAHWNARSARVCCRFKTMRSEDLIDTVSHRPLRNFSQSRGKRPPCTRGDNRGFSSRYLQTLIHFRDSISSKRNIH
jgi:hypothetical protein